MAKIIPEVNPNERELREWMELFTPERFFVVKQWSRLRFGVTEIELHEGNPIKILKSTKSISIKTELKKIAHERNSR